MELLREITAFCSRTGMPITKFGRLAVNDPRLVGDLRRGRQPRPATRDRVKRFIAERAP